MHYFRWRAYRHEKRICFLTHIGSKVQRLRRVTFSIYKQGLSAVFAKVQLHFSFIVWQPQPTGMSPPPKRPPLKFLNSGLAAEIRRVCFVSAPVQIDRTQIRPALSGTKRQRSSCTCLWSGTEVIGGDGAGWRRRRERDTWSSAKRPSLQVYDSKVVGFGQAAVVEGEAGAAAADVQILIHPQTKVTTEGRKCRAFGPNLYILDCYDVNLFLMIRKNTQILRLKSKRKGWKKDHYLPPPIAKESRSPLMKKEFSPVHLKHCRQNKKGTFKM